MNKTSKLYALLSSIFLFFACVLLTFLTIEAVLQQEILLVVIAMSCVVLGFLIRRYLIGVLLLLFSAGLLIILMIVKPVFLGVILCVATGGFTFWKFIESTVKQKFSTTSNDVTVQKQGNVVKQQWFYNKQSINDVYEWEDINAMSWFGDTTIHLGNTLLPNRENSLIIHKLYGDIRIIVPFDVGIVIQHSTLYGQVLFEQEEYALKNNQLTVYSNNYAQATKVIKIVTTIYFGNLEVVYL